MAKEIERKFLVAGDQWRRLAEGGVSIRQGYVITSEDRSLRVRIYGDGRAMLTVKIGPSALTRDEFEVAISTELATEMLDHAVGMVLEKVRYEIAHRGFTWEVDVYGGSYKGLVVAEIELDSESDRPELPAWVGREVTGDSRYSNQSLALSEGALVTEHASGS